MIEFEIDYLHVWVDLDVHLMHSEWLRSVSDEEYRHGNEWLVSILQKYDIKFWIADSAKLGQISEENEQWTMQELVPAIISLGIKKLARVSGEDKVSYNKFNLFVEKAAETNFGGLEVRQFMSYKEAADWVGEIHT